MRIAILGTRGVPANYGGFETFAEKISERLVKRGHEVTVYGRSSYVNIKEKTYNGVNLVVLPTISHKYLDTPAHTFLSSVHACFQKYDILLFCNSANAFCTFLPRVFGHRIALNVDGLEWKRAKWNAFGSAVYRFSEMLSCILPHKVVTDAGPVQDYYLQRFGKSSRLIPYGAPAERVESRSVLDQFNLKTNEYILYVSRLEPENNAHVVIKAFESVKTDKKLVIVGDAPYSTDYIRDLKSTSDDRIIFTGYVFGSGYREFLSNAYAYVQATEVGGTHPALVEAMGHGNCVLANDVPEHREVVDETGLYFDAEKPETLVSLFEEILKNAELVKDCQNRAQQRVRENYSWEQVTNDYEALFYQMTRIPRE